MNYSKNFRKTGVAVFTLTLLVLLFPAFVRADERHGINPAYIDRKVKPATDFYQFANGVWLDKAVFPQEKPWIGAWREVIDRNQRILREVVEKAAKDTSSSSDSAVRKVGLFYRVGMNQKLANIQGIKPLKFDFDRIASITNTAGVVEEIAHQHRLGFYPAFQFFAGPDFKDSTAIIAQLYQGGLGLPDREYYFRNDQKSKQLRDAYEAHISHTFVLLGDNPSAAGKSASEIMAFETRLAKASMTREAQRDPNSVYHRMRTEDLASISPNLTWTQYFIGIGKPKLENINVAQPEFLKEVSAMLADEPISTWKAYLRWNVISNTMFYLSKPLEDEGLRFNLLLGGATKPEPRWRRVLDATDVALGEAEGQLFVERTFPPEAKIRVREMVNNIKAALRERILELDWMGAETKALAIKKLDAITMKVGYPDKWRDYTALEVKDDSYVQNVLRANDFEFQRNLNKIGKPVDRDEWGITPQAVDAYYNASLNEIVLPAGKLQSPWFDVKADDASNYGGIGMTIGHEITHGFDDEGRQYDGDGNLKDWWTAEDTKRYIEKANALVAQYSSYTAVDEVKVNGKATLGENIADLGGIKIAYLAFMKLQKGQPSAGLQDGFTQQQRFFLSFAQGWRRKYRPDAMRLFAQTDPHSPPRWRVLGALANTPAFDEAFGDGSAPGSKKYITIW